MNKLITEAIADANAIQSVAEERAKEMLIKEFSPKIKSMLASVINEEGVSTGSDQPGGYSPEKDQDALGDGTDINTKGAGPDNLAEEDELDVDGTEDQPVVESDDMDADDEAPVIEGEEELGLGAPGEGEEDEVLEILDGEEGGEEDPMAGAGAPPPAIEEEDPMAAGPAPEDDDTMSPDQVVEAYRKRNQRLIRHNQALREAVSTLSKKFKKIDLFNAKLAYAFKLMTQPGLTRTTKKQIAETFDAAQSVREAKLIYRTLKNALNTNAVQVAKKPLSNKNVRSVLSESTRPAAGVNRMSELAGL